MPATIEDEEDTETMPDDETPEDSGRSVDASPIPAPVKSSEEAAIDAQVAATLAGPHQPMPPAVKISGGTGDAGDPLLPPPVAWKPKPIAAALALDWQGTYNSMSPQQKQAIDVSTNNPKDPEGEKKRYVNSGWLFERTGHFPQSPEEYRQGINGYAALQGWDISGKTPQDSDLKFNAKVTETAKMERDEGIAINGLSDDQVPMVDSLTLGHNFIGYPTLTPGPKKPDTAAAIKSRQESLVYQAYHGGTDTAAPEGLGGAEFGTTQDKVTGFHDFEEAHKDKLNPANKDQRWQLWSKIWDSGQDDRTAAATAATQIFPILARGGDVGGIPIEKAVPIFDSLTPEQQRITMDILEKMKSKGGQEGVDLAHLGKEKDGLGFGEDVDKLVAQGFIGMGRAQQNLWDDASIQGQQDALRGWKFQPGQLLSGVTDKSTPEEILNAQQAEDAEQSSVGLSEGMYSPEAKPGTTLTQSQADAANALVAQRLKGFETYHTLREFAQNGLNSVRRDTLPQKVAQIAAESAVLIAYTATPAGLPVRLQAYRQNAYQDFVSQGIDADSATAMAGFVAPIQAAADSMTLHFISKNPVVDGFFKKYATNFVTRFATRAVGGAASGTAIQILRDPLAEAIVKDFGSAMSANIPGTDWEAVGRKIGDSLPETAGNMLLLSAFGAGFAHGSDFKGPGIDTLARDAQAMHFLGFRPEQIKNVVEASKDGAGDAFREEFARREPVNPGDLKSLTPAQAAEFAAKAQQSVTANHGSNASIEPGGVPKPNVSEPLSIATLLKEHFPEATDEELAAFMAHDKVAPNIEEFQQNEAEQNMLAGVREIFRDAFGWHLDMEDGKIHDAGSVDTALQMRDELAVKGHGEAEKEATKTATQEEPKSEGMPVKSTTGSDISTDNKTEGGEPHEEKETAPGQAQGSEVLTEGREAGREAVPPAPEQSARRQSEPAASEQAETSPEIASRSTLDEGVSREGEASAEKPPKETVSLHKEEGGAIVPETEHLTKDELLKRDASLAEHEQAYKSLLDCLGKAMTQIL